MGAIIARFLETGRTLTITSRIIVISHSASPPTASLLLQSGNIPRGSSSFSTTISLQRNASERTTFFVSGSYLVQKSDALSRSLFALHAYVITGFGDIPAVSMLMHMKGHNGLCPCRMCSIQAIRIPDLRNKTLYVPLSRRNHPTPTGVVKYSPENLPLRSHDQFMVQAKAVESAPTGIQREELARHMPSRGSLFSVLSCPSSFPSLFLPTSCIQHRTLYPR